jgi:DNA-binding NarL/FixJ family response regulator
MIRARASENGQLDDTHKQSLLAARMALDAGHSLAAMAAAEAQGRQQARDGLRSELLRKVTRSAKRVQEATDEHHREVRRAAAIGLSTRDIASAAGLAHGTVRAIISREDRPSDPCAARQPRTE